MSKNWTELDLTTLPLACSWHPPPMTPAKPTTSISSAILTGKKWKAINEVVADVSLAHHENVYKIAKLWMDVKMAHQVQKEKVKWKAVNEQEQAGLEHKH
jgi:hypothetical protein